MACGARLLIVLCIALVAAAAASAHADPHAMLQFGGANNKNFYPMSPFRKCNIQKAAFYCNVSLDVEMSDGCTVYNGLVYCSDWSGKTFVFDVTQPGCPIVASTFLPNQTGRTGILTAYGSRGTGSRNAPALAPADGIQVLGDLSSARVYGMSMATQQILWTTVLSTAVATRITASQAISACGDYVYVAVSSLEEGNPACFVQTPAICPFRGLVYKLRLADGSVVWRQQMAPGDESDPAQSTGYAGAAVWGGALLEVGERLYVGTGNTYRLPDAVKACLAANRNSSNAVALCVDPAHMPDAIVCLNATSGAVLWYHSSGVDDWTVACGPDHNPPGFPLPTCDTANAQDDADYGQGPMLVRAQKHGRPYDVLVAGQKNGFVRFFDPISGVQLASRSVCPGSTVGGQEYGHTANSLGVFFSCTNGNRVNFTLVDGTACSAGAVSALDPRTMELLWQRCDLDNNRNYGYMSSTRDLVFAGSMAGNTNNLYALDAATGALIRSFYGAGSRIQAPLFYKQWMIVSNGYTVPGYVLGDKTITVYQMPDAYLDCADDDD
jgi:outer membrane protein assembly factor BamB